jgi:hypothetical protein
MRTLTSTGVVAILASVGACGPADRPVPTEQSSALTPATAAAAVPNAKNFVAHISGASEVPARDTRGVGELKLQLSDDGTELDYQLISSNITNVVQSHIHIAPEGVNGPIVVFLYGPAAPGGGRTDGVLATGTITAADLIGPLAGHPLSDLIAAIEADNAYVNVHTNDGLDGPNTGPGDFPGGEIRGQVRIAGPTP